VAFGFVEDIHVSSNTCKDVQACANTGSVSDEKSKNVQIHASLSKDFAGSLLDGDRAADPGLPAALVPDSLATDDEVARLAGKFLTVRQVAKVLGVCPATVYRLCDRGGLLHSRMGHAIRIAFSDLQVLLKRPRREQSC